MTRSRGVVISDLHYFSTRSNAEKRLDEVHEAIQNADICVLNGDIFDFRWTRLPSIHDTILAAVEWLQELMRRNPACTYHYVLGNHDSLPAFVDHFPKIVQEFENFSWQSRELRIGTNLFLHGDIIHSGMDNLESLDLYRKRFDHDDLQHGALHHLYSGLVLFRLHKVAYVLNRPNRACEKVLSYYRTHSPELLEGVTDIFFGHTHAPFSNYRHQGILFHNTGSMIRGLRHAILVFEV
ncbi:MAG: metallophosphoesterase [Bdellovibrionales bacterium]|nr:metallophosphoesterase [Bdellovibrionales bacterium]